MFKGKKCERCENKIKDSFDYCPYCGLDLRNPETDEKDFGLLGKNNVEGFPLTGGLGGAGLGITDRMINSLIKNLMRSLNRQFQNEVRDLNPEVHHTPNGIKIKFGVPQKQTQKKRVSKKSITDEQIQRMSGMPRTEAKN